MDQNIVSSIIRNYETIAFDNIKPFDGAADFKRRINYRSRRFV